MEDINMIWQLREKQFEKLLEISTIPLPVIYILNKQAQANIYMLASAMYIILKNLVRDYTYIEFVYG